jgi:acetyl esterase/lipase
MNLSLELRTRLFNHGLMHNLRYEGPGRIAVDAPAAAVPAVVRMLSAAHRADLALAVIAAMPAAAGADALELVLDSHAELIESGDVPAEQARAAIDTLPPPPVPAADGPELLRLLAAARGGDIFARIALVELLREESGVLTPAGARRPGTELVDPVFTWELCEAIWDTDRLLATSIAEALCDAVRRCVALGVLAPEGLTSDGAPRGQSNSAATAAAVLLLSEMLPGAPPLDGTPAARGTALDERLFLAGARRLPPDAPVASGVTARQLLTEHSRPELAEGVGYRAGVRYGEAEGVPLRMHLFTPPPAAEPSPVVVFVHGGGWESGSPAKFLRQGAEWAAAGWLTASIGYRLVPQAVWPAQLHDVLAALSYINEHADEFGADPSRVGLVGNSAGGQLVLMAASRDEALATGVQISGVVTISPLTDTLWPAVIPDGRRLVRRLVGGDESLLEDASPAAHVQVGMPPVLTITGELDALTTPAMLADYHRLLDEAGVRNQLHVLPGRYHAFEFAPVDSQWWSARAFAWLQECFSESRVSS